MAWSVRGCLVALGLAAALASSGASRAEAPGEPGEAAPKRPLEVADLVAIGEVGDPQLSPDGKWIAYTVTCLDLDEDESHTRIWMAPAAGGEAVPMTAEDESSSRPRWSPDGRHLAFLSERGEGGTQVWTLFREGGEAVRRTDLAQGVEAFEWSPDGERMVLVLRDPRPEEIEAKARRERGQSTDDMTPPPKVVDRRQFKRDYVGYLDRHRTHLYVLDLASETTRQITSGDYDDSEPAWSPDGRTIAFVSNRTDDPDANYNDDVWLVSAESPDAGGTLLRLTSNPGPDHTPAWSPDGRWVAFTTATNVDAIVYATFHVGVVAADGEGERALTAELDRMVYELEFAADGRSILFTMEDGGEQPLARVPVGGGRVERLVAGERTVEAFDVGPDGKIAVLASLPQRPAEVYLLGQAYALEQRSHVNDGLFAGLDLGAVEKVRYDSPDGTPIEAFVVKPPGFREGMRYPVVLRIHGGPMAQFDHRFHFEAQLWAANGYLVVMPNPRGSTGYGEAFCLAIWREWGVKDYEDVIAGVDHVIERGWGDPQRLGVGGWSYGGMLTNHVITRTDRFAGAYTGASAALYVVNYGHDEYQRWWEYELGLPWNPEHRALWDELSPFNRVESIVTPLLIVGGEQDWNVPIVNSEQLFQALKRLGRTVELVVYPGEYHGIATPSYQVDRYERYLDWFALHVKKEAADAE